MHRAGAIGLLAFLLLLSIGLHVQADLWTDDYETALRQAKDSNRFVLLDFTGSDWCGWCRRLNAEVLDTPEFDQFARQNLVCVRLDFPRHYQLPAKTLSQNMGLMQRFAVQGFPTIILLDEAGSVIGRLGYQEGGAGAYVKELDAVLEPHRKKPIPLTFWKKLDQQENNKPASEYRLWLGTNGDAVEARLLKRDGDFVEVQNRKGERLTLDLRTLDKEDRAFVDQGKAP